MFNNSLLENLLIWLVAPALLVVSVVPALFAGYLIVTHSRNRHQATSSPALPQKTPIADSPELSDPPPPETAPADGLLAASTFQGGKLHNQDSYFCEDFGACKVIVIADGISSSDYASLAARQLTQTFYGALQKASVQDAELLTREFLAETCCLASRRIATQIPSGANAETTLILLAELADRFLLAYLGDGGAVWVRGNLREGKSLLLAHHDQYGRLCGFVGSDGIALQAPTVVEISKSEMEDGDILLIGTDGALPPRKEASHAFQLLADLYAQAEASGQVPTVAEVTRHISDNLARRKPDDNATLGILFTSQAFAYWQHQSQQKAEGNKDGNHASAITAQAQPDL